MYGTQLSYTSIRRIPRLYQFAGLLLFAAFLLAGCAREKPLRAEGDAAILTRVTAPGAQNRLLPWDHEEQRAQAAVTLPLPLPAWNDAGDSPGLAAARAWLDARDRAREDLLRQLHRLPAAEPPPGEANLLTLRQFAQRAPGMTQALDRLVAQAEESRHLTQDGRGRLVLTLPLKPLAEEVLDRGGGFSPDTRLGQEARPRLRAQADAERRARENLTRELLSLVIEDDFTIEEWVWMDQRNRVRLQELISEARPFRSEEVPAGEGMSDWVVELEVPTRELLRQARRDYKEYRREFDEADR